MSSLGRASINIDLNKSSISAINDQNSLILKNANDIIIIKPLKVRPWASGSEALQRLSTIISAFTLITTTIVLARNL